MAISSRQALLIGGAFVFILSVNGEVAAQTGYVPNFQSNQMGWEHAFGGVFPPVQGSAMPMTVDPAHPHFSNEMARINNVQPTYWIGDLRNPNLKQPAKDVMKKDNDEVIKGKIAYTPGQSCQPQGIPAYMLAQGPLIFVQTPKKITMIEESSQQVRQIYMNVPHSMSVKPSWLGESVGHYEGDTLVIDTIGLNNKTFIDPFRTPHSDKLHVVERWRITENGNTLQVRIRIEDPDTFYQPWETFVNYRRARTALAEEICQEGNLQLFDYGVPQAKKPDF